MIETLKTLRAGDRVIVRTAGRSYWFRVYGSVVIGDDLRVVLLEGFSEGDERGAIVIRVDGQYDLKREITPGSELVTGIRLLV